MHDRTKIQNLSTFKHFNFVIKTQTLLTLCLSSLLILPCQACVCVCFDSEVDEGMKLYVECLIAQKKKKKGLIFYITVAGLNELDWKCGVMMDDRSDWIPIRSVLYMWLRHPSQNGTETLLHLHLHTVMNGLNLSLTVKKKSKARFGYSYKYIRIWSASVSPCLLKPVFYLPQRFNAPYKILHRSWFEF